ncbi:MAG TPA: Hpt domain-containing protein, partial [Nitrospiraceae bacterium]|nr:Hpt domain-containing protein [Nitrospiraceae bacterium]
FECLISVAGKTGAAIVVRAMTDSAPGIVDGLRQALERSDPKECRRYAHILKTNAKTVGAEALARRLEQLEHLSEQGRLDEVRSGAVPALDQYEQLVEAMRKWAAA